MDDYHVIVLADDAQPAGDITLEEARRRLMEARGREEDIDERAEAELRAAMARVEIEQGRSLG
jgi:F0F1-type ATP synthase epsilon subunit